MWLEHAGDLHALPPMVESTYFIIKTTKNNREGEFSGKPYIFLNYFTLWWSTERERSSFYINKYRNSTHICLCVSKYYKKKQMII